MFVINSIVDLKKNKIEMEPGLQFNCIQGDSGAAYKIVFNFRQCINTKTISGILTFSLPNGQDFIDTITFDDNQSVAYYKLKDEILALAGDVKVSLNLIDENRFTVYTYFTIHVKERVTDNVIDIDTKDPSYLLLQSLLTEVKNLETSIKSAETIRVENENLRIEAETVRERAEELRKQAEEIRIENEKTRISEWEELKQEILDKLNKIKDGKDAVINGYNTVEIIAGNNISLEQEENILKINGTALSWKQF